MSRKAAVAAAAVLTAGLLCVVFCSKTGEQMEERRYLLEQIGPFMIIQAYADGFEDLTLDEKIVSYYLYRAAVAGRDITYDQHHENALAIRDILEGIVRTPEGIDPDTYEKIHEYTKLFWINNGMYNDRTREKFVPAVDFESFREAALTAFNNGARMGAGSADELEQRLSTLERTIFDRDYERLLANKSPLPGQDALLTSANNLYDGVSYREAQRFQAFAKNGLNSKLIKQGGQLIELVYRAGTNGIPPGMYAREIGNIIGEFEHALEYANDHQRSTMEKLSEHFKTGDLQDFHDYNVMWVQDTESMVDYINGFIEVYLDVMGQKAEYEGGVFFKDMIDKKLMDDLAAEALYFEAGMPWDDQYKKSEILKPEANSIISIVGTGGLGPLSPSGINLPNEQAIREQYSYKNVVLKNVRDARDQAVGSVAIDEFALPEEREAAKKYGAAISLAEVAMHEVIGHGSGKVSPDLQADPQTVLGDYYSAMEEARAELVALHHMFDDKVIELGLIPDKAAAETAYRSYARADLMLLRNIPTGDVIADDHMKGTHLIVQYIMQKTGAIEKVSIGGTTYYRVTDIELMREGVAELLAELMRIKAVGDYAALKQLIDTYATKIDTGLRDEVVARAQAINYPSFYAVCWPELELVRGADDAITDVVLTIPENFTNQQFKFSDMYPRHDN
ncbi:peptidase M49 [candidate division KSB1 bacterium]